MPLDFPNSPTTGQIHVSGVKSWTYDGEKWILTNQGMLGLYGAFSDYTTQTVASTTTAYPITLNTTDESNGVSIGTPTSRVVFSSAGTYNFQWSGQFRNTDNGDHDVQVWLRKNGTDVVGSTGLVSIPGSHGGQDGHTIAGWNYVLTLTDNDYLELVWQSDSTSVTIATYAGGTSPTTPSTASMVVTATQVMKPQVGPQGPTGPAKLVQASNTTVTVSNTTNETNLFSFSQAAIASTSVYKVVVGGKANISTGNYRIRFYIGSTLIWDATRNETGERPQHYDFSVAMVGSKSSQKVYGYCGFGGASTSTVAATNPTTIRSSASEDLSTAKTWRLTVTMSSSSSSSFDLDSFHVYEITQ